MTAIYYRCLPDYQRRCDCSLADLMLGNDCGVEVLTGGEGRQADPAHVPAIRSAAPRGLAKRQGLGARVGRNDLDEKAPISWVETGAEEGN